MATNKPVQIVTIKNRIPLYKGEEQSNAIEIVELEEVGYELVTGLYQVGDKEPESVSKIFFKIKTTKKQNKKKVD